MRLIPALIALLWAQAAVAADAPQIAPPPLWVRSELDTAATPSASAASSTAATQNLLVDEQVRFGPSSTSLYFESVARAQTAQGLAALGTVALPWKPDTGTLTVHKVNILRGGQVIDALAGKSFTVLRRETNLESAMLDGVLTATLQVEGLRVGDALDLAVTYDGADPVLKGHSEMISPLSAGMAVDRLKLRALWARPKVMRWRAGDGLPTPKVSRGGDQSELVVDMRAVEPLAVPKGAPSRFGHAREIEFTDFNSWADVSALFAPLYAKAATLAPDSPLRAEAARIRAASSDPAVQAAAALVLVQDKVRYVFLGMNDGGLTPADADVTWSRRFGDCKGKTALLLALLKALGIEAQPALAASTAGDGLETRLPTAGIFDHVLVRAAIAGKVYWLDGTRTGDRDLGSIRVPPFLWALPIQTAGAALTPLAAAPLAEPDALTVLKLDASAGLSLPAPAHAEIRLRGDVATDLNLKVADLSPANLDRVLRGYWTKQYDFIEVKSVKATFDKANGEETWVMDGVASMAWDTTAGATGKRYEANNAGLGWKADFKRDLGPHIDAPFAVDFPFYEKSVETIILPNGGAGFVIDGDPIDKLVAGRAFLRGARIDKGVFSMQASTRALIREFPAGEALAAEAALRGMANEGLFVRAPANYADTDQEIDKLIASQPKTASEFTDRGWALLQRDAIEKAVADFDKAIALDGAASLAYADRAGARFQLGQFDGAKADAAKATALDPRQAVAWRVFGLLAAREGRFADAAAMYTRAIGEDSSNAWTYGQRASAYWDLSDSRGALADLARELDLDPASADAANDRATIFNIIGRPDLAKAEMDRLVAARPDDQAARVMRSLQFARMGRGADARRDIEAVIAVKPTADEYLIAANERDKDDLAGRWADVDAALKLDPKAPDALVLRAGIEDRSGKPALAIQELSDALTVQPKPLELRIARARAYGRAGDMKLAGADFSEVRAAATGDADRMNALCWAEAAFPPLLDAALRDCDASVRLAPLHAAAIDSRALVLLRLGRLDEALAAYDKALMLRPHQGASLYGRGIVKLRKGLVKEGHADLDAARRNYARAGDELNDMGVRP